jgi:hypothetical protein
MRWALSTSWPSVAGDVFGVALGRDGMAVALWPGGCWGQSGDLVPGGDSGVHREREKRFFAVAVFSDD